MNFINLTPHEITVVNDNGEKILHLSPSGVIARVAATYEKVGELDGIPFVRTTFSEIEGLPQPTEGVVFVTSSIVAQAAACQGRKDVVSPDTGPSALRNEQGQIVAVKRFQTWL